MTDFTLHTPDSASGAGAEQLQRAREVFGMTPNLLRVLADAPPAARAYLDLHEALADSSLTPTEQQVATLAASFRNECGYCMAAESAGAHASDMDPQILEALRHGEPLPDSKLEALRTFTIAVVDARGWVGDDAVEAFLHAGFDRAQVLEVVLAVAKKTLSNYVNHIAGTPVDEAFQDFTWEVPETVGA